VLANLVYRYKEEKPITQKDLTCNPANPNDFFINLLNSLDYSIDALKNAYSGPGILRHKLEDEINAELEEVAEELNDLLNIDEKKYYLRIDLEKENMEFSINYGDGIPLNLDRQSQGFKWLFNLFFGILKVHEFEPGDMILIDEFGDSLGFSTVKELAAQLREYGQDTGITFIVATQNPLAVDIRHLDEVRLIVPDDDGSSHIINQFDHFSDCEEHDVIAPIINGLMVSRNFMRTENRKTVFVEGAMDYFYLNAFAEMMRMDGIDVDIDFIPMNGLGSREDSPEELIDEIRSIERNPIILVDSDKKGLQVSKKAKSMNITVSEIGEIFDNSKKEIEDLFSNSDAEKYHVHEKSFDIAACFSQRMPWISDEIDEETKNNFRTLIDYIMTI